MNYNKPVLNNQEIADQKIIEELKLKAGKKIRIIKLEVLSKSDVPVTNKEMEVTLKNDVKIGCPIEFTNNGSTSDVLEFKKIRKQYFFRTKTSIYELIEVVFENSEKKITDFESFETSKGSVYNVLPNGQVQRIKHALNNPNYYGDDKGGKKEKDPSDIIIFYNPKDSNTTSWLMDFQAERNGKTVSQLIDIGVYKQIDETTYQLVKNSAELGSSFLFIRVEKEDSFKLKEVLDITELRVFKERICDPINRGLGAIISSDTGNITNIPVIGFKTVDYKYYEGTNTIHRLHCGNTVVSINERK